MRGKKKVDQWHKDPERIRTLYTMVGLLSVETYKYPYSLFYSWNQRFSTSGGGASLVFTFSVSCRLDKPYDVTLLTRRRPPSQTAWS